MDFGLLIVYPSLIFPSAETRPTRCQDHDELRIWLERERE